MNYEVKKSRLVKNLTLQGTHGTLTHPAVHPPSSFVIGSLY